MSLTDGRMHGETNLSPWCHLPHALGIGPELDKVTNYMHDLEVSCHDQHRQSEARQGRYTSAAATKHSTQR